LVLHRANIRDRNRRNSVFVMGPKLNQASKHSNSHRRARRTSIELGECSEGVGLDRKGLFGDRQPASSRTRMI
jgi:hypothetical protein